MSQPAKRMKPTKMNPPAKRMKLTRPTTKPITKRTAGIDDLPPEMICKLFEYLPPKDLVVCSMINKRWHSIYANFKLHRLVAENHRHSFIKWLDSNQTIQEAERCRLEEFRLLARKPLLSNLKHLALRDFQAEFDLKKLNRFAQLVHLEINTNRNGKVQLNLPNLKVLKFYNGDYDTRCSLSINCPLLSTFVYDQHGARDQFDLLTVKHPESIRKLNTRLFDARLAAFKSVDCLVTRDFQAINKATLLTLPRLRELHYNRTIESFFDVESRNGTLDRTKQTLNEFLNETGKLSDFRFTFSGLQLTKLKLDQIDLARASNEEFYMNNYRLIEPGALDFLWSVDYTKLLSHVTGEFPRCFSEKFTGIEMVEATIGPQDADHFLWFLKSLRLLRILRLSGAGLSELSQEFYDQLPAAASSLDCLSFYLGERGELQLNFDFIAEFPSLFKQLYIRLDVSLRSLHSLVRSLGRLDEGDIYVRSREERFRISKKSYSTKWKIFKASWSRIMNVIRNPLLETENCAEIVTFFEEREE